MRLNVKNPETCALVRKLAKLKGQSITQVVTDAVRKDLARTESEAPRRDGVP